MDFTDKTVLITGGSRGIGRATAKAFARLGARVAITFVHDHEAARETVEALDGEGHLAIRADIAHPEAVERLVDAVVEEFERIDVLVNNAGVFLQHAPDKVDYATWQKAWQDTLSVNLIGAANISFCVAREMMKTGGGRIVNVSSRGAFRGEPGQPAYGASKAGLNALSQSLAQALAPYNIYVHALAPGFVETAMARPWLQGEAGELVKQQSPLGRVATVEEVANAILFLASPESAFTTGCILDINGASYLRT
ncbi:MAG TPA: SDR family oxidoreductase [Flavilitoribacter sp.]|nr:SDR family oxidoreductase [Flavilitoribacter sp.]